MPEQPVLDAADTKIITLAKAARARIGAAEGAAVRDADGRTYVGCTVRLPALRLTAVQVAVAAAVAAGAASIEAVAVVTDAAELDAASLAAVGDLGPSASVLLADPTGVLRQR